jgi:hypothetical protein
MRLTIKRHWLVLCVAILLVGACATPPKTPTQDIYVIESSFISAVNAVADLHDSGILHGSDYDNAKALVKQADAALKSARTSAQAGDATKTTFYLNTLTSLLSQLALYTGSKP